MASVTGATLLNDKWDQLGARFDLLYDVPIDQARLVNAAISDWQDWYWEKYENWPSTELLTWQDRYVKTAALVDALSRQTKTVSRVEETKGYKKPTGPVVHLPPLLITARPPPPPYVPPPPIVYESPSGQTGPAPARVRLTGMDAVDVSDWERMNLPEYVAYSRDPGTQGWSYQGAAVGKADKTGLVALVVAIGAGIWAKYKGVL